MCRLLVNLSAASSISCGLLVAATRSTPSPPPPPRPSLSEPPLSRPSTDEKNSVLMRRSAECSLELLLLSKESISSVGASEEGPMTAVSIRYLCLIFISPMKTMEGASLLATSNSALTIFSPSPTNLDERAAAVTLKKDLDLFGEKSCLRSSKICAKCNHLVSPAKALANMVFPLPGGPKSKMPFGGESKPENSSGL